MNSRLLIQYLRTGEIDPLTRKDSKGEVEAKLGPPGDWKGRNGPDLAWAGPPVVDFHDSAHWHYGNLCVSFDKAGIFKGISLDFSEISHPLGFAPPFLELPDFSFSLRDVIDLMDRNAIAFEDNRGERDAPMVLTEGGVVVFTFHGNCSPKARVLMLYACDKSIS